MCRVSLNPILGSSKQIKSVLVSARTLVARYHLASWGLPQALSSLGNCLIRFPYLPYGHRGAGSEVMSSPFPLLSFGGVLCHWVRRVFVAAEGMIERKRRRNKTGLSFRKRVIQQFASKGFSGGASSSSSTLEKTLYSSLNNNFTTAIRPLFAVFLYMLYIFLYTFQKELPKRNNTDVKTFDF